MSAQWCPECNSYVELSTAGLACGHGTLYSAGTVTVPMQENRSEGADGISKRNAASLARSGDDLLEGGCNRGDIPDGLNEEHAEMLRESGDALEKNDHNKAQRALREEVSAVIERVQRQHRVSTFDVVGTLFSLAHDELHVTKYNDCGNCVEQDEDEEDD